MSVVVGEEEVVWPMPAALVLDMVANGLLGDERVELLNGRLLTMAPQGPEHRYVGDVVRHALSAVYGHDHVSGQAPLLGDPHGLPEPDVFVTCRSLQTYRQTHPDGRDCRLVVEVAYSSHRRDRQKAEIYASIGVPEYWMVDLVARRIEVHRDPVDGARYRTVELLSIDDTLQFPGTEHRQTVASLLGD